MPICDGLLATERIRALEVSRGAVPNNLPLAHRLNGNRIPIVAISARVYEADINRCRQVGMDGFICKPVNLPLLNDVLQSSRDHEARSLLKMDSQFNVNEGYWF
jgi:CheY-like chemotaxis protein